MLMEIQIGRNLSLSDKMPVILWIMPSEKSECSLPQFSMNVLDIATALDIPQDGHGVADGVLVERSRLTKKSTHSPT